MYRRYFFMWRFAIRQLCIFFVILNIISIVFLPNSDDLPNNFSTVQTENTSTSNLKLPLKLSKPIHITTLGDLYKRGYFYENSRLCPGEGINIKVFITIFSSPTNKENRKIIRMTWGHFSKRSDVALGFLIGSFNNDTLRIKLKQEQHLYGDIIQTKCLDSYENLTYKTLSMLDWVNQFCPKSKFILKTDDDMFINVLKLLDLIETIPNGNFAMYGKIIDRMTRFKDKNWKHYLPTAQYPHDVLPTYLCGPAYLIPVHIAQLLLNESLSRPPFRLEDVFISGIVAKKLKIKLVHISGFYNFHMNIKECNAQNRISLHNMNQDEQLQIWKNIHNPFIRCGLQKLILF
ncbi:beta-1,3-galactosyltransferase 1-like [Harmonia axyridis]|uniref:beta-1,3-galactosyltransferase 1-like n=1 Tax=Harmonia axyridis TaxID=115357 RepID=UPI001E275AB4|nr:beta-1,3-galactosyltransferase 1-like [Harmonia axyridis]